MPGSGPDSSRWRTAHHEAGHALVGVLDGLELWDLVIHSGGGTATFAVEPHATAGMNWGGPIAEAMKTGKNRPACWSKHESECLVIAEEMIEREPARWGGWAAKDLSTAERVRAERLINRNWLVIREIAAALFERGRLEGDEVVAMIAGGGSHER